MNYFKLILILLLFVSIGLGNTIEKSDLRQNDKWFAMDKLKHLTAAMYLYTTSFYIQNKMLNLKQPEQKSFTVTLTCCIGKEIWDSRKKNNFFSYKDLAAGLTGTIISTIIINNIK